MCIGLIQYFFSSELAAMKDNIARNNTKNSDEKNSSATMSPLVQRPVLMPLLISLSLMFFQQWSGVNAVIFFTVTIFSEAGTNIDENLATIIVGVVQFFATFGKNLKL